MSERRTCLKCQTSKLRDAFSDYQWSEGRLAKCRRCALGAPLDHASEPPQRPWNPTCALAINMHAPLRHGFDGWACEGELEDNSRAVVKWKQSNRRVFEDEGGLPARFERSAFDVSNKIIQRAAQLVSQFNAARYCNGTIVRVNAPVTFEVVADDGRRRNCWQTQQLGPTPSSRWQGQQVRAEQRVPQWAKWNSNTGWTAAHAPEWCALLSHFSFHVSGGECLLCDLKGGEIDEGDGLTNAGRVALLSDPCLHSRGRRYGPSDLGCDGISSFFSRHICTDVCRGWLRPPGVAATLPAKKETTLECPRILPPSVLPPPLRASNRAAPLPSDTLANVLEGTCFEVTSSSTPVYVVDTRSVDEN